MQHTGSHLLVTSNWQWRKSFKTIFSFYSFLRLKVWLANRIPKREYIFYILCFFFWFLSSGCSKHKNSPIKRMDWNRNEIFNCKWKHILQIKFEHSTTVSAVRAKKNKSNHLNNNANKHITNIYRTAKKAEYLLFSIESWMKAMDNAL